MVPARRIILAIFISAAAFLIMVWLSSGVDQAIRSLFLRILVLVLLPIFVNYFMW
jgi:hypothetical protein